MAELVILIRDRETHPNPYEDVHRMKRGDVIEVLPDGHVFSPAELAHPNWRIIKIPGLSKNSPELVALTVSESGDPKQNKMLRIRKQGINCSWVGLPQAMKTYLADDSRAAPSITATASFFVANRGSMVNIKTPLPDPAVIG